MKRRRSVWGTASTLVLGGGVAACAALSGLQSYSANCTDGTCDATDDAGATHGDDGTTMMSVMDARHAQPEPDVVDEPLPPADDAADDASEGGGAADSATGDASDAGDAGAPSMDAAPPVEASTPHDAAPHDAAPTADASGCECDGTACCGTSCQVTHASGLPSPAPSSYSNCSATGNDTEVEATAACLGVGGSQCLFQTTTNCGPATVTNAVCGTVSGNCYCWSFSGVNAGTVNSAFPCTAVPCTQGTSWN